MQLPQDPLLTNLTPTPGLRLATPSQIERIYRESHPLWAAGLSLRDYIGLWEEVRRTPWAQRNVRFHVWADADGEVLSSLKLYRPLFRLGEREERVSVMSAIFTPRRLRRQGYARAMLRDVLRGERERGSALALLFSDIGEKLYGDLGFRSLAAFEHRAGLARLGSECPPGWTVERLSRLDAEPVRSAHREGVQRRGIGALRDEGHWDFLETRSRSFFRRLRDPDVGVSSVAVCREDRFVGYLSAVEGRGEWNVREVGAVGGDPENLARVIRLGAFEAASRGLRRLRGWLPPEVFPFLSGHGLSQHGRIRAIPMVRVLNGPPSAAFSGEPEKTFIPFQDQF